MAFEPDKEQSNDPDWYKLPIVENPDKPHERSTMKNDAPFTGVFGPSRMKESYEWMLPGEVKPADFGEGKVTIRGTVLYSDGVSANNRHYVDEELVKAARTLTGKPINVNHDNNRIIGHVARAEYNNGAIEFYGQVNNKAYAERSKSGDPNFKGWSVQADFWSQQCPMCKEHFTDNVAFHHHMTVKEGVLNFQWEPRGIVFNGLAYVEGEATPGVSNTKLEVMETKHGMNQLLETLQNGISLPKGVSGVMLKLPSTVIGSPDTHLKPKLREWWGKYDSMEACVAANGDKDDPQAYCASIHGKEITEHNLTDFAVIMEAQPEPLKTMWHQFIGHYDKIANEWHAKEKTMKETVDVEAVNLSLKESLSQEQVKNTTLTTELQQLREYKVTVEPLIKERDTWKTRAENAEDKVKGLFKGHGKPIVATPSLPLVENPDKG